MKPKPPCPACGHPPASMIEDGYSIDLTPWWRYYVQKFNPFKRRRRMVPMDDVVPLILALLEIELGDIFDLTMRKVASDARKNFLAKHPLP
jgi:hypothetical protein